MAWKKGRKDNEYDVNFKAGWGRSNHRRLGSTISPPTLSYPPPPPPRAFSTHPAILTPHTHTHTNTHTHPRTLNFDFIKLQEHLQPGGNACIMLREATSFDEARSCSAWNSTGKRRKKRERERKGKGKKDNEREQGTKREKKREQRDQGMGREGRSRERKSKEGGKERERERERRMANSPHQQTTLISGY